MKKLLILNIFIIFNICFLQASEYVFEGINYIYVSDTYFCFDKGNFKITKCNNEGNWSTKSFPYVLSKEGAYLVANVRKENKLDKLYIFCADRKHLIFYDSDENEVYDTSEKIGHRDEAWIISGLEYQATSYLSEILDGKKIDYKPENLEINKLTSAWVEGVDGYGKDEMISFNNRPLDGSRRLYIINGFFSPKKPSLFYDNNRVKTLEINCYKNGELINTITKELQDNGELQVLEFSERYSSFDFIIKDVYKGKKYDDTAITGIFIDAIDAYEN